MPQEDSYIVIHCSEDGDISVDQYSKEDLLRRVLGSEESSPQGYYGTVNCFGHIPGSDPMMWRSRAGGDGILVIKGRIVQPKPVQRVTEYEIE